MTDPQIPAPSGFASPQPAVRASSPSRGYEAPVGDGYAPPPGASQVPVGGYAAPSGSYTPPAPVEPQSRGLGMLAMLLSLVAGVVSPVVAAIASYELGRRLPEIMEQSGYVLESESSSLAFLSPAREQVLWIEVSFWTGTVLGLAALVMGIIAVVKRRGRAPGIVAIILAVVGPILYTIVAVTAVSIGTAAGAVAVYGSV